MKSNLKSILALTSVMAAMGGLTGTMNGKQGREYDPKEDNIPKKKVIPNGCKEYSFYGHTVIAINENSAIKKCKKLAGIK